MSTLLTPRPRDAFRIVTANQERLFGDSPIETAKAAAPPAATTSAAHAVTAPRAPSSTPDEAPAPATTATLDAAVTSLWQRLTAAEPATCPVCDGPMEPRRSTGAGVVGGRCRSCGSTIA